MGSDAAQGAQPSNQWKVSGEMDEAMSGKACLITGGTGGIGLVTARELAKRGADVMIVGRSPEAGAAAAADVKRAASGSVEFMAADLSRQSEVRRLAAATADRFGRLDVLVNNAGGMFRRRTLSADGIEMTFALNHLAYFLLSDLLLPALRSAGRARIVNVASEAHRGVALRFDDLQSERGYVGGWSAYKRSKLANLLFTYELARRIEGGPVSVNALHPGFVATDIGVRNKLVPSWLWRLVSLAAISPEEGARTSIHLAASREVEGESGKYFVKSRPTRSSPQSYDRDAARRLWAVSERMTEPAAPPPPEPQRGAPPPVPPVSM